MPAAFTQPGRSLLAEPCTFRQSSMSFPQVIQRQENLARKQQEIREEMERKKAEAEEEKARTRRRKARLAAEAARRRSPGAYGDDDESRDRGAGRDARCGFKTVHRVT